MLHAPRRTRAGAHGADLSVGPEAATIDLFVGWVVFEGGKLGGVELALADNAVGVRIAHLALAVAIDCHRAIARCLATLEISIGVGLALAAREGDAFFRSPYIGGNDHRGDPSPSLPTLRAHKLSSL